MPPSEKPIRLLSTDIDGTLLGNPTALLRFNATWKSLDPEKRPLLCYNTGRLLDDLLQLIEKEPLLEPDFMICGVGTCVYDCKKGEKLKSFSNILEEGWDLKAIDSILRKNEVTDKQPMRYQNAYKSSWYLNNADQDRIHDLETALDSNGLEVNVIYSSNRDLDVIPKYANKGNALAWLLKKLGIRRDETLVAGDTGNDSAMFHKRGVRGIVVGNTQPELHEATVGLPVYRAQGVCADGVLEGLLHYGVISEIVEVPEAQTPKPSDTSMQPRMRQILQQEDCQTLSDKDREYLTEGYHQAVEGLRRCMTPIGFAACSPTDNSTSGTDANYRSVWARDGSITVIGSLGLRDPDIQRCQRATLETLLEHISIPGQTPANVSLDTQEADYSGVGGICSIDSGIWLIIACFEYSRHYKDIDFIRKWRSVLQRTMDWLSAHDSNNDGLLEIPEAGDWTDLFGRSYNVLYDECLWFRANICYGRMLEMSGEWQMAGDYLRWASVIKKSILEKFWPSTLARENGVYSFADQQSSIGDTQYLIAQVTPFDFDWRCDVYSNILAFLFDVINIERAQKAFRFMWGVGVNNPFPVSNLYPPVQAGDPGWRDYYTVNLLNLPNHYHNGGIWPFIGAQWVRFINKLGIRDLAEKELMNVARINEQGVTRAWEFNEWAHGETGIPMGKAVQAWSCSEFIHACHELKIVKPS
ncbi:HAD-IIB family hydrolase [Pelagicoccus sp. SDUM812003]|uniref:HAD-IIB family hydrolase n=1 Tax=Pelagicoccus sp. SDUM812003 TaxID=3041267 RepID=UPI00280F6A6C|nr:HAD-IIB family hydrolase [Pelagicoccus sp. SDUM812003]MDQ8204647.1 HAD-IIB family hydrolase [Pelagicoccus sp. SDUM812003]